MSTLKAKIMRPENDPEDIRKAVEQLSTAYRRSAKLVDEAENAPETEAETPEEIEAQTEIEIDEDTASETGIDAEAEPEDELLMSEEPEDTDDIEDTCEVEIVETIEEDDAELSAMDEEIETEEELEVVVEPTLETQIAPVDADEIMSDALRRAEAVLFAAGQPLSAQQVAEILPHGIDAPEVLMGLKAAYANRGVRLVEVAGRWRFQTAQDLSFLFVEERHEQKKLSQASLETLAIIAYGQPVTRAEIEAVRGVTVSKTTIDTLMETGWVRIKGRRKTPGRPVTLGTTDAFLEHFGLESLDVLPGKADLEAEGLLTDVLPEDFEGTGIEEAETDISDDIVEDLADETSFIMDFIDEEDEAGEVDESSEATTEDASGDPSED